MARLGKLVASLICPKIIVTDKSSGQSRLSKQNNYDDWERTYNVFRCICAMRTLKYFLIFMSKLMTFKTMEQIRLVGTFLAFELLFFTFLMHALNVAI